MSKARLRGVSAVCYSERLHVPLYWALCGYSSQCTSIFDVNLLKWCTHCMYFTFFLHFKSALICTLDLFYIPLFRRTEIYTPFRLNAFFPLPCPASSSFCRIVRMRWDRDKKNCSERGVGVRTKPTSLKWQMPFCKIRLGFYFEYLAFIFVKYLHETMLCFMSKFKDLFAREMA